MTDIGELRRSALGLEFRSPGETEFKVCEREKVEDGLCLTYSDYVALGKAKRYRQDIASAPWPEDQDPNKCYVTLDHKCKFTTVK